METKMRNKNESTDGVTIRHWNLEQTKLNKGGKKKNEAAGQELRFIQDPGTYWAQSRVVKEEEQGCYCP